MLKGHLLFKLIRHRFFCINKDSGFALPIAIALGLVMISFARTSILVSQNSRNNAIQRRASGASILVSDGAISRALLELNKPNNGVLLIRNYDPINATTGKNYLGSDSVPKKGDESTMGIDELAWVEEIYSSKNNASNQYVNTLDASTMNTLVTPGATAGIAVPDNVSSLADLLEYIDWPTQYRYGTIKNWQRVK